MTRSKLTLTVLLSCLLGVSFVEAASAKPRPKSVRIVYLVSADRTVREDFRKAIEMAAKDLQKWYAKQLGGATFRLNEPVVEVVKSDQKANWFYSHPNGNHEDNWGFNNGFAEAQRLVGTRFSDPEYVWVIYSDGPGNKGRGGNGVTVLPEDDLLGLVGEHPTQKNVKRWIAGLGHELGHAFGLRHPEDTNKDRDALMWTGIYGKYPGKTYLTEEDKRILMRSRFFFQPNGDPVVHRTPVVEKYVYSGGYFGKFSGKKESAWVESKSDGSAEFHFVEKSRDKNWIQLFDTSRNMTLRLPIKGGMCSWSTDGGRTWNRLYQVVRAK